MGNHHKPSLNFKETCCCVCYRLPLLWRIQILHLFLSQLNRNRCRLRIAPGPHLSPPTIFQLSKRSITTQIWQNYFCVIFPFNFYWKLADLMRRLKAVDCISIMRFIQAAFVWLTPVFVAYMIRVSYESDDVQFNSVFFLSTDRLTRSRQGRTWSPTLTHKNYFLVFNINKAVMNFNAFNSSLIYNCFAKRIHVITFSPLFSLFNFFSVSRVTSTCRLRVRSSYQIIRSILFSSFMMAFIFPTKVERRLVATRYGCETLDARRSCDDDNV